MCFYAVNRLWHRCDRHRLGPNCWDAEADVPSQRIVSLAVGVAPEPGDGVLARWEADWHAGTVRYASNATHYDIYFADGSGKTVDADGLRVVVRGHVHAAVTLSAAAPGANGEL